MKTKRKINGFNLFAVIGFIIFWMPFSLLADTNTPLDCPGVIAVDGGYQFTRNTTCNLIWDRESNKFLDLMGFTLKADVVKVFASNITLRNGVIRSNGIRLGGNTMAYIKATSLRTPRHPFIETEGDFIVKNCFFTNIKGSVMDLYIGTNGGVRDSVFFNNGTAIWISGSNNVLVNHNKFISNGTGILLRSDPTGVNNNVIRNNIFQRNGYGIYFAGGSRHYAAEMRGNKIIDNKISGSRYSGIFLDLKCLGIGSIQPDCPGKNTIIRGNILKNNGLASLTGVSNDAENDGISARATVRTDILDDPIPYPEGLANLLLKDNIAYRNADLGFDVNGVTDGKGQIAAYNGNPAQCDGVLCKARASKP